MHYGPLSYYTLGRVYPRDRLRLESFPHWFPSLIALIPVEVVPDVGPGSVVHGANGRTIRGKVSGRVCRGNQAVRLINGDVAATTIAGLISQRVI